MKAKAKLYFNIITTSGVPIYRQIIDQVKTHIATGKLTKGMFLPSVRQVASELEINSMTVSKAYSLLEKEGVLEAVRGRGMRIKESGLSKKHLANSEEIMAPILKEVIIKSQQLSLNRKKVVKMLESLWKEQTNE